MNEQVLYTLQLHHVLHGQLCHGTSWAVRRINSYALWDCPKSPLVSIKPEDYYQGLYTSACNGF